MIREDTSVQTMGVQTMTEAREDVRPMTDFVPVALSPSAAIKLAEVLEQKGLPDASLRVFVSGGGCSGLQYGMAFETQVEDDDYSFVSEGMNVVIDPVSIAHLQGATVDFVDSLMGGGFKIENPNAVASCGCGSSFRPAGESAEKEHAGAEGGGCGSGCGC